MCEHHPEHTADCGYTEGTEETPCTHEHSGDCYTFVTECVHVHDENCYFLMEKESVSGNAAVPSVDEGKICECTHECSKEGGCIKEEGNCNHEHDENCGYAPAVAGTPCTFVCEICKQEDLHLLLNLEDKPVERNTNTAALKMTKQDADKNSLDGAGFALFQFTGTDDEFKENPDDEEKWKAVDLSKKDDGYFSTANAVEEVRVPNELNGSVDTVFAVVTAGGAFSITDIPAGHYYASEVKTPDNTYLQDQRKFYFTVNMENFGKEVKLYTDPQQKQELMYNNLKNYKIPAQLALVKYDKTQPQPQPDGEKLGEGFRYTTKVLKDGSANGLERAVYKLFRRRGAGSGVLNPYPKELEDADKIVGPKKGYDICIGMGSTDSRGILKLEDMRGPNNGSVSGLGPAEYYMIEVKAPEGYLLDQEAITFSLNERIFEGSPAGNPPGLVMLAENDPLEYAIRLIKVYEEQSPEGAVTGLPGAEFEVKADGKKLSFTGTDGEYHLAESGQDAADKVCSGPDGELSIVGLKPNTTYTVTEIKAPKGYRLPENPEVSITTPLSAEDGVLGWNVVYPKTTPQIKNERLLGRAEVYKKSEDLTQPLEGAEFTLYETVITPIEPGDPDYDPNRPAFQSKERIVKTAVTNKDGYLSFDNLPWSDHYYIVETKAPNGYLPDQTKYTFKVNEDSFTDDGQAITVTYTSAANSGGNGGETSGGNGGENSGGNSGGNGGETSGENSGESPGGDTVLAADEAKISQAYEGETGRIGGRRIITSRIDPDRPDAPDSGGFGNRGLGNGDLDNEDSDNGDSDNGDSDNIDADNGGVDGKEDPQDLTSQTSGIGDSLHLLLWPALIVIFILVVVWIKRRSKKEK